MRLSPTCRRASSGAATLQETSVSSTTTDVPTRAMTINRRSQDLGGRTFVCSKLETDQMTAQILLHGSLAAVSLVVGAVVMNCAHAQPVAPSDRPAVGAPLGSDTPVS